MEKPVYNVKPVLEGGILTAIAVIFALMSAYLPLVGSFMTFVWPMPIIILGVRHGYKWSVMAALSSGIIIALLVHPLQALSIVICFAVIGIVIAHGIRQGYAPLKILFFGTAASLVSKLAFLGVMMAVTGINPMEFNAQAINDIFIKSIEFYRGLGVNEQTLQRTMELSQQMLELAPILIPTALLMSAVMDTYLNFYLGRVILNKLGHKNLPGFPLFKTWQMPRGTIYALAVAMLMMYWGQTREISLLYSAGVNLQIISTVMLLIQGTALAYFLASKYNISGAKTGIVLMVMLFTGLLTQVLIFAGIFDLLFDYRKLNQPRGS
ncbi:MAG: YybS family protein [Sporomusaceae bacterium]|nr:YybS family protein [Sporomusaceae bacterium]